MLVLSRKAGESIRIGDDLVVTITRVRGNRVQISIDAPREVSIRRGELTPLEAQKSNQGAAPKPSRQGRVEDTRPMLLSVPGAAHDSLVSRSA